MEGANTSCSVEWKERTFSVISYNVSMFVFVFFVPLAIIVFTNIRLITIIKSQKSWFIKSSNSNFAQKKNAARERKATIVIIFLICK